MSTETQTSAFDIRLIIALLTGVYGVILTILGLFVTSEVEIEKSAGVNINLWAGIALLVVGLLFPLWVRVKPLRVPVPRDEEEATAPQ